MKGKMHLVLTTDNLETAYREKKDWQTMGYTVRIYEKTQTYKGAGNHRVYRVWAHGEMS